MNSIKVMTFLEQKKNYLFPNDKFESSYIERLLITAPEEIELYIEDIPFKDPSKVVSIALLGGILGLDRFYLEDYVKGVLKFATAGGFFIWTLKDVFSAKERCREYNCKKLVEVLNDPSVVGKMQDADNKIQKTIDMGKKLAPIGKELVKGMKDIQDSMHVK